MQTEDLLQHDVFDTAISEESRSHLAGISLWMQINAITAFVSLAVSIFSTIWLYMRINSLGFGSSAGGNGLFRLFLSIIVTVIMNLFLIQAATNIKKGLTQQDQQYFNLGLYKMATYFKIMGIQIIVALSLMLLVFFFALVFRGF